MGTELEPGGSGQGPAQLRDPGGGGRRFADKWKKATFLKKAVENILTLPSKTLDLSEKKIQHLTEDIYRLPDLQHLHLERNQLAVIPEDLFQKLPNLVWLDLRDNKIKTLPPGIGCHKQLTTLLLEGNPIKRLPVELGNLTSLKALNLRHCPLEFPPKDIVQKGLQSILCFLRNAGNGNAESVTLVEIPPVEKLNLTELLEPSLDLSDEWPNEEERLRFQKLREEIIKDEQEEFLADRDLSPKATTQKFTELGKGNGIKERLYYKSTSLSRKKSMQKNVFPEFSSLDKKIQTKRAEECRLAAQKQMKEKLALIEQQRKDKEMLQEWRNQTKLMKEKKEVQFKFSTENADMISKGAPYATDGYEKQKEPTLEKSEQMKLLKLNADPEGIRASREKKVKQCIKWHIQMMKTRKNSEGTPLEVMQRAKQDIETVEKLQAELAQIKQELLQEYRFTAFTGEPVSDSPRMQPRNIFFNMKF
ncbi:leucine-rich repeat-containing protein 27 isoform A [Alligator mississippiensis]|uniref:Leucine-rich repeat-containing protein 27 isoform A n=1 Tax=Alligator mississippiensis TaxID=8496 RepID=A0A151P4T3_ALLMI|nr:leucine-rich repeat-containing protein 27 isoform A [Alligator mississippiensis]